MRSRCDSAASEQGLKIMVMLYLTPVLPLGLVSYMCGTTSMNVYHFAFAKVFSAPLYLVQTFIGASAHSFIKGGGGSSDNGIGGMSASEQAKEMEENRFLVFSGISLSLVMISLVTRHIRSELMKVRVRSNGHLETSGFMVDCLGSTLISEFRRKRFLSSRRGRRQKNP